MGTTELDMPVKKGSNIITANGVYTLHGRSNLKKKLARRWVEGSLFKDLLFAPRPQQQHISSRVALPRLFKSKKDNE